MGSKFEPSKKDRARKCHNFRAEPKKKCLEIFQVSEPCLGGRAQISSRGAQPPQSGQQPCFSCLQLGARHVHFGRGPSIGDGSRLHFQPLYWDIFVLATIETLQQSNATSLNDSQRLATEREICAWHAFMSILVEYMRHGYEQAERNMDGGM